MTQQITHQWREGRMRPWLPLIVLAVVALSIVGDLVKGEFGWRLAFPIGLVLLVSLSLIAVRWDVSADAVAIRPKERWRVVHWADVDHVRRPGACGGVVCVVLKDGRTVPTGFPLSYAEDLAALGRVPLSS
ncbi:hypothetical protein PZ938_00325 [Luteipulveratus sp. YIM 133132]|uniref:PH domain-containing protein n=1 Tax=Luteipulveratus flavus TaxID=3031728 RepID=A0ABT6C3T8_9MICO|nr:MULTISPECIES: hypothetical protein [unclassified Luteipulveratus]MDE9364039.1 hypothetical protein [Luteipulveratus sp. YIM 133132]MDF8263542.1 hypothetical protein [Luteipulveratus sp. YIM 133296]